MLLSWQRHIVVVVIVVIIVVDFIISRHHHVTFCTKCAHYAINTAA